MEPRPSSATISYLPRRLPQRVSMACKRGDSGMLNARIGAESSIANRPYYTGNVRWSTRDSPRMNERENKEIERVRAGLCATCAYMTRVHSDRGSLFYRCERSVTDPAYPKYPRLPVMECAGWVRKAPQNGTTAERK